MLAMTIILSVFSFSVSVQAAHLATVVSTWITESSVKGSFNYQYTYTTISFVNGFNTTTTSQNVTNTLNALMGISDIEYTNHYSTY